MQVMLCNAIYETGVIPKVFLQQQNSNITKKEQSLLPHA